MKNGTTKPSDSELKRVTGGNNKAVSSWPERLGLWSKENISIKRKRIK